MSHNRSRGLTVKGIPGCESCEALKDAHDRRMVENGKLRIEILDLKSRISALEGELAARRVERYLARSPGLRTLLRKEYSNGLR